MEYGKPPFQVTIKWSEIGRAALGWAWDTLYKYTTPNPNGYRGENFIHENPENVGYVALRESDDGLPTRYDSRGYPVDEDYQWTRYEDGCIVHTPPHHTKDNFVMNRNEADLGWTDMGEYLGREI
ncbi:MAG: hypothetical protein KGI25_03565 [Thaumarchaeota archaeon]|nr:hypothetical protein [Nitrososphaerota archaeon]